METSLMRRNGPRASLPSSSSTLTTPTIIRRNSQIVEKSTTSGFLTDFSKGIFLGLLDGSKAALSGTRAVVSDLMTMGSFVVGKAVETVENLKRKNEELMDHDGGIQTDDNYRSVDERRKRRLSDEPDLEVKRRQPSSNIFSPTMNNCSTPTWSRSLQTPTGRVISSQPEVDIASHRSSIFEMPFRGATQQQAIVNNRARYASINSPFRRPIYQNSNNRKRNHSLAKFDSRSAVTTPTSDYNGQRDREIFLRSGGVEREFTPENPIPAPATSSPQSPQSEIIPSSQPKNHFQPRDEKLEDSDSESESDSEPEVVNQEMDNETIQSRFPAVQPEHPDSNEIENDEEEEVDESDEEENAENDSGSEEEDEDDEVEENEDENEMAEDTVVTSRKFEGKSGGNNLGALSAQQELLNVIHHGSRLADIDTSVLVDSFVRQSVEVIEFDHYDFQPTGNQNEKLDLTSGPHSTLANLVNNKITKEISQLDYSRSSLEALNGSSHEDQIIQNEEEDSDSENNDENPDSENENQNDEEGSSGEEEEDEEGEERPTGSADVEEDGDEDEGTQDFTPVEEQQLERSRQRRHAVIPPAVRAPEVAEEDDDDEIICEGVFVAARDDGDADEVEYEDEEVEEVDDDDDDGEEEDGDEDQEN